MRYFLRHSFQGTKTSSRGMDFCSSRRLSISPLWFGTVCGMAIGWGCPVFAALTPDQLLLKEYRPKSIFQIPATHIDKARYPVIDVHSHHYARTQEDVDRWVKTMDKERWIGKIIRSEEHTSEL